MTFRNAANISLAVALAGVLAWSSMALTGAWAPIAFWGGLLLSNAGPAAFGYAFWMREQGLWH